MSGYDPEVSGPWSDVDERPVVYTPPRRETAEEIKARVEEEVRRERRHRLNVMEEWDRWEGDAADQDPEAYRLAREIRLRQPTWADGEECGVTTEMVRAALDVLKA